MICKRETTGRGTRRRATSPSPPTRRAFCGSRSCRSSSPPPVPSSASSPWPPPSPSGKSRFQVPLTKQQQQQQQPSLPWFRRIRAERHPDSPDIAALGRGSSAANGNAPFGYDCAIHYCAESDTWSCRGVGGTSPWRRRDIERQSFGWGMRLPLLRPGLESIFFCLFVFVCVCVRSVVAATTAAKTSDKRKTAIEANGSGQLARYQKGIW